MSVPGMIHPHMMGPMGGIGPMGHYDHEEMMASMKGGLEPEPGPMSLLGAVAPADGRPAGRRGGRGRRRRQGYVGAEGGGNYGPDGMPLKTEQQELEEQLKKAKEEEENAVEREQPWYRAETWRKEIETMAVRNLHVVTQAVDNLYVTGRCPSHRWTNDPDIFPDLGIGIIPFAPNDDQLYCPRMPPQPKPPPRAVAYPDPPQEAPPPPDASGQQLNVKADPFLVHNGAAGKNNAPAHGTQSGADGAKAGAAAAAGGGKPVVSKRAVPGDQTLNVTSQTGLSAGQIKINPNGKTEEIATIVAFAEAGVKGSAGALTLGTHLKFAHEIGEKVEAVDDGPLPENWREGWSQRHQRHFYWYEYPDGADDFGASASQWERPKEPPPRRPHLLSELEPRGAHGVRLWQPWVRLVDFGIGGGIRNVMKVFSDDQHETHMGRVYQGQMDNMYLVAALNALSCRPRLARQLFLAWDVERSIYIVKLFKNGTWVRVEIDDYMPAPIEGCSPDIEAFPFCCRSEFFPHVLWPSLVEKAYAKLCTLRPGTPGKASGGWEAIGGGGRIEDALADLTGGCAGQFQTHDVSPDRLFVYLYELQRDCLFVAQVNIPRSSRSGVPLNPAMPYIVNRADYFQMGMYVQLFYPSADYGDGGITAVVPDEIVNKYPEKVSHGFAWMSIYDFHNLFGTVYECRLTNSADAGIVGMPKPRLPYAWLPNSTGCHMPHAPKDGAQAAAPFEHCLYDEWCFANGGKITEHLPPEFTVVVPPGSEVVTCIQQCDERLLQTGPTRKRYSAILMKVYQHVTGNSFSEDLVCKSDWRHLRDSMCVFKANHGGMYKIICEMPHDQECHRLVMRCYTSKPGAMVSSGQSMMGHVLVEPMGPPLALKWSMVGCIPANRMTCANLPVPLPHGANEQDLDEIRKELTGEDKCVVM